MAFVDLTGKTFTNLTVLERASNANDGATRWKCLCACGNETIVYGKYLKKGTTKGCGCLRGGKTHGMSRTKLYNRWHDMKIRCTDETNANYYKYGARGIRVCEEWSNDFMAFFEWSNANGYQGALSIDRIDVNGPYSPDNCRWATVTEQNNNKTNTIYIEINGVTKTCGEWASIAGITTNCLRTRYIVHKWTGDKLLEPLQRKHKPKEDI